MSAAVPAAPAARPRVVDDWWYVPAPAPGAARRLFCFPHAGGDVTAFRGLAAAAAPDAEVWALRLPGRGGRWGEAGPADFDRLADTVAASAVAHLRPGSAFYGQSFGALLGHEVARRLPAGARPAALLAASARAPHTWPQGVPEGTAGAELLLELSGLAGALAGHPEYREAALTAIRADLDVCHTYRWRPGPVPDLELHALTGADDPAVGADDLAAWAAHTRGGFSLAVVPGGHLLATVASAGPVSEVRALLSRLPAPHPRPSTPADGRRRRSTGAHQRD